MKIACYSTCGPNVCSFFCSPSLSLSPLAFAIFYSLLMFASFLFYIFQYFLHCHCVHGIGGPSIFICGHFFVHNLLNTCYINFLIVDHTHDDIDALCGWWSYKLKGSDYPTLLLLIKSFLDTKSCLVIPHLIEEVCNFKIFVEGYLCTRHDALEGHTHAQQFKFYKDGNGWPLMQYKSLYTNNKWLPKEGDGIWL